jgi:hypothetical protein
MGVHRVAVALAFRIDRLRSVPTGLVCASANRLYLGLGGPCPRSPCRWLFDPSLCCLRVVGNADATWPFLVLAALVRAGDITAQDVLREPDPVGVCASMAATRPGVDPPAA